MAAPAPETGWRKSGRSQYVLDDRDGNHVATVTKDVLGMWHAAFPPHWKTAQIFSELKDAKTFCEVTAKLCGS